MITKIGVVSGEIWHLLEKEGRLPLSILLSKVGKNIAEDEDVVYMGVGWGCYVNRRGGAAGSRSSNIYIYR